MTLQWRGVNEFVTTVQKPHLKKARRLGEGKVKKLSKIALHLFLKKGLQSFSLF